MHLNRKQTLGSQCILSSAVWKAVVLGLEDRESAGEEEPTVEELKRRTSAWWLACIHTYIIQYVSKFKLQYIGELPCSPLIKHFFKAQYVDVGWKQWRYLPGYITLLAESLRAQSSGILLTWLVLLVRVTVGIEEGKGGLIQRLFCIIIGYTIYVRI